MKDPVDGTANLQGLMPGVAIVADSWYQANTARKALQVTWAEHATSAQTSEGFQAKADSLGKGAYATKLRTDGDVASAVDGHFADLRHERVEIVVWKPIEHELSQRACQLLSGFKITGIAAG